ncbi:MAG: hypothetical protein MJ133_10260 [Lachnospiraceae bacterium]|nr:hypothetical protein [Lachnospiraceae bacterium]
MEEERGLKRVIEERRGINRVEYKVKSVIVTCDTYEKIFVDAVNVSPLGMGIIAPKDTGDLVGRQIIIVADTLIMYADVIRQVPMEDGTFQIGIHARQFTPAVLQYLFEHIAE